MPDQEAGQEEMSKVIGGEGPLDTVLGSAVAIEPRAGIVDKNIHMVEFLLDKCCQAIAPLAAAKGRSR